MTNSKLNKLMSTAIDTALTETGLTMQERVATGVLAVWNETRQNEPFAITETEANVYAFNAQKKDTLERNKRLNVQVEVPDAIGYETKKFTTFDNNVARVRLSIINAPHLTKALKIVDKLVLDGLGQSSLMLHKAMQAVGEGTGETWEADKRSKAVTATTAKDKREADKITAEGFNKRLKALVDDAEDNGITLDADGVFVEVVQPKIDDMPDATPNDAPEVMDADAIAKMMDMPQFQHAMAAFMVAAKK